VEEKKKNRKSKKGQPKMFSLNHFVNAAHYRYTKLGNVHHKPTMSYA
jgi:hypothetical protein